MSAEATSPKAIITAAAASHGIDPSILWGVFGTETSFGKDVQTSSAGAVGPLQLEPATARSLGVKNPLDLTEAANGAAKYLAEFKSRGTGGMLSAYNAGPDGGYQPDYVNKTLANAKTYGTAPTVTSTSTSIPGLTGARGAPLGVLKPATTAPSLDLPALQAAEHQVGANRVAVNDFGGGGAGNPLKGILDLTMPSASSFEKPATTTPATAGPAGNIAAPQETAKAVSAAVTQLGVPYKWGGETEKVAFDCSGLTQWAYRAAGIAIPRTAQEQYNSSQAVTGQPQPGQLVFFGSSPTNVTHVEMVVGGGKMIGADTTGTNVRYENLPAVGSQWGNDKVLGVGTPTGQPGGPPRDAAVAPSAGSVVASYRAPAKNPTAAAPREPRAIVHHATGKVEHVASSLPVGHAYEAGDVLGVPLTQQGPR